MLHKKHVNQIQNDFKMALHIFIFMLCFPLLPRNKNYTEKKVEKRPRFGETSLCRGTYNFEQT